MFFKPAKVLSITEKHHTLDAIRGIAVLLVMYSHLDLYNTFYLWPLSKQPLQGFLGQLGVYLFFLLSGLLIWSSANVVLDKKNGLKKYLINRFTRIYPLYILHIMVIILLSGYFIGKFKPNIDETIILRHLFFLQSFSPKISSQLNDVLWTLSHEFLFYLLVPLIYFLKPSNRWIWFSIVITQALWLLYPKYLNVFVCYWTLFAIGILYFRHNAVLKGSYAVFFLVLSLILMSLLPKLHLPKFIFAISVFNLLLSCRFQKVIFKPLIWMGLISYSIYLWHRILILFIAPYFPKTIVLIPPYMPWLPYGINLRGLLIIMFVILFSLISYYIIEKPCMTHLRKFLQNKFAS